MTKVTANDFNGNYQISQGSVFQMPSLDSMDPRRLVVPGNSVKIQPGQNDGPQTLTLSNGSETLAIVDLTFDPENMTMVSKTADYKNTKKDLILQVSIYQDGSYKMVYGTIVFGDPENVGVWGADDGQG